MPLARKLPGDAAGHEPTGASYEHDMHAWAMDQAALLRRLKPKGLDVENIAEELETLGRSERREIQSRLRVLLLHLLKFRYQPDMRKGGWEATIKIQREDLLEVLEENPSLKSLPRTKLDDVYRRARLEAAKETGIPEALFPKTCPFTVEEIMDDEFFG
jgi:hypothetical protein